MMLDAATEAYVQQLLDEAPPLPEEARALLLRDFTWCSVQGEESHE